MDKWPPKIEFFEAFFKNKKNMIPQGKYGKISFVLIYENHS
jgi:hypothetical protein